MADYDFESAFARIEDELLRSMIRNMKKHSEWEDEEGFNWSMWQTEQLKALEKYKQTNRKKFKKEFSSVNRRIKEAIEEARKDGNMEQEIEILEALKKGYKPPKKRDKSVKTQAAFFRLNDRKMDALINATVRDMEKAETAVLRMANDKYRKIIFDAQVYAGLNCVEYANGARHTLKDYAMMAIRTASKRAYLQGEGEKRQEWGISTVIVNKRGNPCPKCLPFCGKVLIDDVWSGGKKGDGPYPLLSSAIAAGLYHPNCKDSHTTYFPGVSTPPDGKITTKEISTIKREYAHEQRQQYIERQAEKYDRLATYSLDQENRERFADKADAYGRQSVPRSIKQETPARVAQRKNNYIDATEKWAEKQNPGSNRAADLQEFTAGDTTYAVDGKHVLLDYTDHEKRIADAIAETYGKDVQMVPRVVYPQNIQTPDYLIDGAAYDLKTPTGNGKNTLYGLVKSKKRQANNFVICIDKTALSLSEIERQIEGIYDSDHTRFVDTILLLKEDRIIKAYKRKK